MTENSLALNLREKLDEIDHRITAEVFDGFYQSRLRLLVGMWEKGKAIGEYRGVNSPSSYRELEEQTGRDHHSLKRWHDLYLKYPEKDKYLSLAEKQAEQWTQKELHQDSVRSIIP